MQAGGEFSLRERYIGEVLIFLLFFSMACLPFVPQELGFSIIFFVLAYMGGGLFWLYAASRYKIITLKGCVFFAFFCVVMSLNCWKAISEGVGVEGWLRSFVPMAFFLSSLFLYFYVRMLGAHAIFLFLLIACFVYCMKLLVLDFDSIVSVFSIGGRLSYYSLDVVVPFPYLGVMIAILLPGILLCLRIFLFLFFLFFVFIVGYKSQVVFLVFFLVMHCLTFFYGLKRLAIVFLGAAAVLFICLGMQDYLVERLASIGGGGDQVRLLEIKYAWSLFLESPVLGAGLGTSIPLIETRPDYYKLQHLWVSDSVSYIHNFFFYLLMTGGGAFLLFFSIFSLWGGVFRIRSYFSENVYVRLAAWTSAGLIVFWLTSASFKQMQTVIILCVLFSVSALLLNKGSECEQ